jgi:hypothetical protein
VPRERAIYLANQGHAAKLIALRNTPGAFGDPKQPAPRLRISRSGGANGAAGAGAAGAGPVTWSAHLIGTHPGVAAATVRGRHGPAAAMVCMLILML